MKWKCLLLCLASSLGSGGLAWLNGSSAITSGGCGAIIGVVVLIAFVLGVAISDRQHEAMMESLDNQS